MKNGPYELIIPPIEYPGKRYRGRYAYEHRVTWWKETGKNPDDYPNHVIHHADEKKRNNDSGNLHLKTRAKHVSDHKATGLTMHTHVCKNCKKLFTVRKYNAKFCSRQCIGFYNFPGQV
jgi:hypothetical protein